jgi:hypothetical protein
MTTLRASGFHCERSEAISRDIFPYYSYAREKERDCRVASLLAMPEKGIWARLNVRPDSDC